MSLHMLLRIGRVTVNSHYVFFTISSPNPVAPMNYIEYGLGYIITTRSPYIPYSIYLRGLETSKPLLSSGTSGVEVCQPSPSYLSAPHSQIFVALSDALSWRRIYLGCLILEEGQVVVGRARECDPNLKLR